MPILEDLPRTLVVSLRLRNAVLRRAVAAFGRYAHDYFASEWPSVIHTPRKKRARKKG